MGSQNGNQDASFEGGADQYAMFMTPPLRKTKLSPQNTQEEHAANGMPQMFFPGIPGSMLSMAAGLPQGAMGSVPASPSTNARGFYPLQPGTANWGQGMTPGPMHPQMMRPELLQQIYPPGMTQMFGFYPPDMLAQNKAWGQAGLQGTGDNANMVIKKELVQQLGTEEKPSVQSPGAIHNNTQPGSVFLQAKHETLSPSHEISPTNAPVAGVPSNPQSTQATGPEVPPGNLPSDFASWIKQLVQQEMKTQTDTLEGKGNSSGQSKTNQLEDQTRAQPSFQIPPQGAFQEMGLGQLFPMNQSQQNAERTPQELSFIQQMLMGSQQRPPAQLSSSIKKKFDEWPDPEPEEEKETMSKGEEEGSNASREVVGEVTISDVSSMFGISGAQPASSKFRDMLKQIISEAIKETKGTTTPKHSSVDFSQTNSNWREIVKQMGMPFQEGSSSQHHLGAPVAIDITNSGTCTPQLVSNTASLQVSPRAKDDVCMAWETSRDQVVNPSHNVISPQNASSQPPQHFAQQDTDAVDIRSPVHLELSIEAKINSPFIETSSELKVALSALTEHKPNWNSDQGILQPHQTFSQVLEKMKELQDTQIPACSVKTSSPIPSAFSMEDKTSSPFIDYNSMSERHDQQPKVNSNQAILQPHQTFSQVLAKMRELQETPFPTFSAHEGLPGEYTGKILWKYVRVQNPHDGGCEPHDEDDEYSRYVFSLLPEAALFAKIESQLSQTDLGHFVVSFCKRWVPIAPGMINLDLILRGLRWTFKQFITQSSGESFEDDSLVAVRDCSDRASITAMIGLGAISELAFNDEFLVQCKSVISSSLQHCCGEDSPDVMEAHGLAAAFYFFTNDLKQFQKQVGFFNTLVESSRMEISSKMKNIYAFVNFMYFLWNHYEETQVFFLNIVINTIHSEPHLQEEFPELVQRKELLRTCNLSMRDQNLLNTNKEACPVLSALCQCLHLLTLARNVVTNPTEPEASKAAILCEVVNFTTKIAERHCLTTESSLPLLRNNLACFQIYLMLLKGETEILQCAKTLLLKEVELVCLDPLSCIMLLLYPSMEHQLHFLCIALVGLGLHTEYDTFQAKVNGIARMLRAKALPATVGLVRERLQMCNDSMCMSLWKQLLSPECHGFVSSVDFHF